MAVILGLDCHGPMRTRERLQGKQEFWERERLQGKQECRLDMGGGAFELPKKSNHCCCGHPSPVGVTKMILLKF